MPEYWIATDGSTAGDGSPGKPWPTLAYAFSRGGGGVTYNVAAGVYAGNVLIPLAAAGTAAAPTVIRSVTKYGAVLYGSPWHGLYTDTGCDWITIDGFEVGGARLDGIKLNGNHGTVQNCWVHQNGNNGIGAHALTGTTLSRNLVEFNGTHVQQLHGIYADGTGLTITANIIRHNSGYGLHLFPSVTGTLVAGNLIYGQATQMGLLLGSPTTGGNNRVLGNTIARNAGGGIQVNGGNGEVIVNNVVTALGSTYGAYAEGSPATAMVLDYNLAQPAQAAFQGPHGLSADPLYVDTRGGAYWLSTGSPAVGKADPTRLPPTDFWGQAPVPADLGAYAYHLSLTQPAARSTWYVNYAYAATPLLAGQGLPDLWTGPT